MYRIAICDDEEYFREKIESIIKNKLGENTCTVDVFEDGRYLLQKETQLAEYDIVFLDIKMQDVGGMEIARKIRQVSPSCVLIFVTSYIDFAVVGYRLDIFRYVLKEEMEEMIPEALQGAIERIRLKRVRREYNFIEGSKCVNLESVMLIESQGHKLIFYIETEYGITSKYHLYGKLDSLQKELEPYLFARIHRGYLVNYRYIEVIKNYVLRLKDGVELPIAKDCFPEVRQWYYEIRGGRR